MPGFQSGLFVMVSLMVILQSYIFIMSFLNERSTSEASGALASEAEEQSREVTGYPFLTDPVSIKYITTQIKILCLISGLPDVQVRTLALDFAETYEDSALCCFSSTQQSDADEPQRNNALCQDQVKDYLKKGTQVIVVNCPSRAQEDLQTIFALAHKYNYTTLLLQPDASSPQRGSADDDNNGALAMMTLSGPGLVYPNFFGWHLGRQISLSVQATGKTVWEELGREPVFVQIFEEHALPGAKHKPSGEIDLDHYFSLEGLITGTVLLHCTTFYSDNGKQDGSWSYATTPAVCRWAGRAFNLTLIGFLATPRTLGARLRLGSEELLLWGNEGEAGCSPAREAWRPSWFSPTCGRGSRAHLTLGVAEDIKAVQTGLDLEAIIRKELEAREEEEKTGKHPLQLKLGSGPARYYGDGLWCVYLDKPIQVDALFSGWY